MPTSYEVQDAVEGRVREKLLHIMLGIVHGLVRTQRLEELLVPGAQQPSQAFMPKPCRLLQPPRVAWHMILALSVAFLRTLQIDT